MLWRHLGILPVTGESIRHQQGKVESGHTCSELAFAIGKHTEIECSSAASIGPLNPIRSYILSSPGVSNVPKTRAPSGFPSFSDCCP
jgi:hypothetical protein